jgi:hypothetical protein
VRLFSRQSKQSADVRVIPSTALAFQIADFNEGRRGLTIENNADKMLYVLCGGVNVSSAFYSKALEPNALNVAGGYFEVPYGFQGEVWAMWAAAPTGVAMITEFF